MQQVAVVERTRFSPVAGHIDHDILKHFHRRPECVAALDALWSKKANINTADKRRDCATRFYQQFPNKDLLLPWDHMPYFVISRNGRPFRFISWWMGGELSNSGFIEQHTIFLHQLHLDLEAFEEEDALEELAYVELERLRLAPTIDKQVSPPTKKKLSDEVVNEVSNFESEDEKEDVNNTAVLMTEIRTLVRQRADLAVGRQTRAAVKQQADITQRLQQLRVELADDVVFETLVCTRLRGGMRNVATSTVQTITATTSVVDERKVDTPPETYRSNMNVAFRLHWQDKWDRHCARPAPNPPLAFKRTPNKVATLIRIRPDLRDVWISGVFDYLAPSVAQCKRKFDDVVAQLDELTDGTCCQCGCRFIIDDVVLYFEQDDDYWWCRLCGAEEEGFADNNWTVWDVDRNDNHTADFLYTTFHRLIWRCLSSAEAKADAEEWRRCKRATRRKMKGEVCESDSDSDSSESDDEKEDVVEDVDEQDNNSTDMDIAVLASEIRTLVREKNHPATETPTLATIQRRLVINHRLQQLRVELADDTMFQSIVCTGLRGGMEMSAAMTKQFTVSTDAPVSTLGSATTTIPPPIPERPTTQLPPLDPHIIANYYHGKLLKVWHSARLQIECDQRVFDQLYLHSLNRNVNADHVEQLKTSLCLTMGHTGSDPLEITAGLLTDDYLASVADPSIECQLAVLDGQHRLTAAQEILAARQSTINVLPVSFTVNLTLFLCADESALRKRVERINMQRPYDSADQDLVRVRQRFLEAVYEIVGDENKRRHAIQSLTRSPFLRDESWCTTLQMRSCQWFVDKLKELSREEHFVQLAAELDLTKARGKLVVSTGLNQLADETNAWVEELAQIPTTPVEEGRRKRRVQQLTE